MKKRRQFLFCFISFLLVFSFLGFSCIGFTYFLVSPELFFDHSVESERVKKLMELAADKMELESPKAIPEVKFYSIEEFRGFVKNELSGSGDTEVKKFYENFGLISPGLTDEEFEKLNIDSQTNLPAAIFNPETEQIIFIKEYFNSKTQFEYILFHELVHYIQHKILNSTEVREKVRISNDNIVAYSAILEGQATDLEYEYLKELSYSARTFLQFNYGIEAKYDKSHQDIASFDAIYANFVYDQAQKFVHQVNDQHVINDIVRTGEITSEMIYHPDKFINKSDDLVPAKFDINLSDPYSQIRVNDVMGEYGCRTIVNNLSDLDDVCSGWSGDNYQQYNRNGDTVTLYVTKWDSQNDFSEAETGIENSMTKFKLNYVLERRNDFLILLISSSRNVDLQELLSEVEIF